MAQSSYLVVRQSIDHLTYHLTWHYWRVIQITTDTGQVLLNMFYDHHMSTNQTITKDGPQSSYL